MEATKTTQITLENYCTLIKITPDIEKDYIQFCKENENRIDWDYISKNQKLTESFIRKFYRILNWKYISQYQVLSEDFIREFKDYVNWNLILRYQKLSEDFICKLQHKLNWDYISMSIKLSEDFIRKFKNELNWVFVSKYQKLSEDLIREFKNYVDWEYVSIYQKLSENFIKEFKNKVFWSYISKYQKLSENFILKFKDYLDLYCIARYQKLSPETIKKLNLKIDDNNWLYKDVEFKKNEVFKTGLYEFDGEYFYGYKGIRSDRYSKFNFQYQYLPGQVYEAHADFTSDEDSFGLSVWTEEMARDYCDELVIKVRFKPKDIARIIHKNGKIRVTRFEVLN